MKAIDFKEQNRILAKSQEYNNLPVNYKLDGTAVSCWELSPEDMKNVLETGKIFLEIHTFREPHPPCNVFSQNPSYMVNPVKQSRQFNAGAGEMNNYYSAGVASMLRAPSAESVIQFETIEQEKSQENALIELDKFVERHGFKRERRESPEEFEEMGIPYLAVGHTQVNGSTRLNSVIFHEGRIVHDTSQETDGLEEVFFYEIFKPINDTI